MNSKLSSTTIIVGILLSYLVLGYSNYLIRIDELKNVKIIESIGYSLFQISHVILFINIYQSNRVEKLNNLLLIPIIIQLIDLVPIELLHSLKFSLVSTFSIIIGWITVMLYMYSTNQKKILGLILIGVICLIINWIPSISIINSLNNENQLGVKLFGMDYFFLIGTPILFYQSISDTVYTLVCIYFVTKKIR
jgi:hypothetical protein